MKKIIILFISLTLFYSCKKDIQESVTIYYYPNKAYFKDSLKHKIVSLNQFKNFVELTDFVNTISCTDSIPVIKIENERNIFNLIPINYCPDGWINCYKTRNLIIIDTDSIFPNYSDNVKINNVNLDTILTNHLLNPRKSFLYSDLPEKAFIRLKINKNQGINKTEEVLVNLFEKFNKINKSEQDSLRLKISLEKYLMKDLPPPPPPQENLSL